MCLFTHFAAGALAGGVTGNVYLGAAAGLASHAVLDVIPHYDHPDWRLELGGGVLGLLVLLTLPWASWPAVVGGLCGMLPDLENLFQKLGLIGRHRFVFPTHTGLLPHGRALGPRSLVWQVAIFVGCFVALGLFSPGTAAAATPAADAPRMGRPEITVLASGAERTVVRVTSPVLVAPDDWSAVDPRQVHWAGPGRTTDHLIPTAAPGAVAAEPLPPAATFVLAVPTREAVSWRVEDVQWWKAPQGDAAAAAADLVRFDAPAIARGVPVTGTEVPLAVDGGILRSVVIAIEHPAAGAPRRHLERARAARDGDERPAALAGTPAGIVNPDLHRELFLGASLAARAAAADKAQFENLFARTGNWVKLALDETGLYRITGQDLSGYGVPVAQVDPTKLRLYRGGGLALELLPEYPDSLELDRIGLNEVAIEVRDGGDGEWNLDDELRFYGVATSAWRDRFEAGAARLDHYDHPYEAQAVYWLTWADDATPTPLPGTPRRATPIAATPGAGAAQDEVRVRAHFEEEIFVASGVVRDNWLWDNAVFTARITPFAIRPPVAGRPARFQVEVRGFYYDNRSFSQLTIATAHLNDDTAAAALLSVGKYAQDDSVQVRLFGESTALQASGNEMTLTNSSEGGRPLGFDSLDLLYWAPLDLTAAAGQLAFGHWGDEVPAPGTEVNLALQGAAGETPLLWDVSDPAAAAVLTGQAGAGDVTTYGLLRDPDTDRLFVASRPGDLLSPLTGTRTTPVDLRARSTDVDYIVVAPAPFLLPAQRLAAFRDGALPGVASPAAMVVTTTEIYDNFAGGQKDPMAIRNYLQSVYEQGGLRLQYVCVVGNASRDYRNYRGRTPLVDLYDLVPTQLRTFFPVWPQAETIVLPYPTDDGLVSFDDPIDRGDPDLPAVDLPDLAIGRLPAITVDEANAMVDRAIAFTGEPEPGLWRNAVMLASDDNFRPGSDDPQFGESVHTIQADHLERDLLPLSVDVTKRYGVDYAFPPGSRVKPALRADISADIGRGTTIYYYVGHGAEDNLADEQIFQSRDIPNLGNGMRRPVFVAFSCDVGIYDSPSRRSMAEQFLQYDTGGAIASICASQVSFSYQNNLITDAFFANLYPSRRVDPTVSVSEALRRGKNELLQEGRLSERIRHNSQRYNFFGDPAMVMPHPVDDLAFAPASLDTLRAGGRLTAVLAADGKTLLGLGDAYDLRVEESVWDKVYPLTASSNTTFRHMGAPVFVGTGTMGSGDLRVPFKVPVQLRYGAEGRVRMILETPDGAHAAVARVPAVPSATGDVDDVVGPEITLAFADNRYRVRPGDELVAVLADTSGIAMLGTTPANSLLLELDGSGLQTDVTSTFRYDPESYTTGRLVFPLPADVAAGRHTAALYANDALGNAGSDTVSFEVVPEGVTDIHAVTLFPNPTPGYCRLLFELSDPMAVQWDIYSLAGSRLRTIKAALGAGPQILEWDGRDHAGDEIANGTYLFVLRGNGATADDREIRKTGKLVIMR
ncbi:hypothetical protein KDM41_03230 [bacterium]|nr:hypothetical protein [bacterium]